MCSEPPRVEQRSGSSRVVAQQQVEFAPKIRVASSPHELSRQLVERRHQCFRNKASAKFSPVTVFVRFAFSDHKWRCHVEAKRCNEMRSMRPGLSNISGFFTNISVQN